MVDDAREPRGIAISPLRLEHDTTLGQSARDLDSDTVEGEARLHEMLRAFLGIREREAEDLGATWLLPVMLVGMRQRLGRKEAREDQVTPDDLTSGASTMRVRIIGGAGKPTGYYLTPAGIVTLDSSRNTDAGRIMERQAISAPVHNGGDRFSLPAFWLDCEVGRVAGGSAEPQVSLQVSRNGEDFGNERWRGLGLTGDYRRRVMWRKLWQAREFTLKLTVTDDVNFSIMSTSGQAAQ